MQLDMLNSLLRPHQGTLKGLLTSRKNSPSLVCLNITCNLYSISIVVGAIVGPFLEEDAIVGLTFVTFVINSLLTGGVCERCLLTVEA